METVKNNKQYAIYYNSEHDFENINIVDKWIEDSEEYIRLTKPATVNFIPLSEVDINNQKIKYIDKEIKKVYIAAELKVKNLEDIKQKLLALPDLKEDF